MALQEDFEAFLVGFFENTKLCTMHAKCVTIMHAQGQSPCESNLVFSRFLTEISSKIGLNNAQNIKKAKSNKKY